MTGKTERESPLAWTKSVNPEVLQRMLPHKLDTNYRRPTFLDTIAQNAVIISKRSTCVWNEVGAIIIKYNGKIGYILSSGYNGAVIGDVDPREAGCARIVHGELQEGAGLCRGSHAELNAIGNLTISTIALNRDDLVIFVTLRPCKQCAKQIINARLGTVYYIWEYSQDKDVLDYLTGLGIKVVKYTSNFLESWIELNRYKPPRIAEKS